MRHQAIIVDDEPLAADIIESFLTECYPDEIAILASCKDPIEAAEVMKSAPADIMFLDIHMPRLTGLEFLRILDAPPLTILTTAHPEYALESYELEVTDYLLKPISKERFEKAVNKAIDILEFRDSPSKDDAEEEYFFVKSDKKYIKVFFADIIYIEGLKDYVIIRLEGRNIIALHTMRSLEEKLKDHNFIRVHRSYIVNSKKISSVLGNSLEITKKNDKELIPIGKSYRDTVQELIDKYRL